MKPVEQQPKSPGATQMDPVDDASSTSTEGDIQVVGDTGWRLWPPSPKMQIALIAIGFGLFNLILIAIWAVVMVYRF